LVKDITSKLYLRIFLIDMDKATITSRLLQRTATSLPYLSGVFHCPVHQPAGKAILQLDE
jgi:hypothetical protein